MATKKKKKDKTSNPNGRAQVDARMQELATGRQVRKRKPKDGGGVDVGIRPGAFISYESVLKKARDKPDTRKRMESHIRSGIEDTLKPIIKLFEREGASEYQIAMLKDVGPNALRSMLEFFEEKNSA